MPFSIFIALYIFVLSFLVLDLAVCFSLVYVICIWVAPAFNEFALLIKKKKKRLHFAYAKVVVTAHTIIFMLLKDFSSLFLWIMMFLPMFFGGK
jgi:hypothetical protein